MLKSETKKEMDYENINEIIAPFNLHIYDENPQNVRGSFIYYPDGEYRQEVFDTREEEGFEEMAMFGYPWLWYFWRKKCLN